MLEDAQVLLPNANLDTQIQSARCRRVHRRLTRQNGEGVGPVDVCACARVVALFRVLYLMDRALTLEN
ncbi:MAG: hypothetical protein A07HR60_01001 [uncultured archaeon A07HR60]|nr:MAG: hypothetical protein A07HR60_01001 [uncultured archaeon A07HR60]